MSAYAGVSIPPMWRWGRLETSAAQYYQTVGEPFVAERTAQAGVNAVVLQDSQRFDRIERHITVVLIAAETLSVPIEADRYRTIGVCRSDPIAG